MKDLKILAVALTFILFITVMIHGISLVTGDAQTRFEDGFPYQIYWVIPAITIVGYLFIDKVIIHMAKWAFKDVDPKCRWCGTPIKNNPYSRRGGNFFCSLKCEDSWYNEYYKIIHE